MLAGGTFWLACIARDTARRQLRAYLFLEKVTLRCEPIPNSHPIAKASIKNFGQTPAREVRSWMRIKVLGRDEPPPVCERGKEFVEPQRPDKLAIPPGDYMRQQFDAFTLKEEHILGLNKRDLTIYVYGRIDYVDAFNKACHTNFCECRKRRAGQSVWETETVYACGDHDWD